MSDAFSSMALMMAETSSIMADMMRMTNTMFANNPMFSHINSFAQSILMDAVVLLNNDPGATQLLGTHIRLVGDPQRPLSKRSAGVNINGRQQSRTDMTFQVVGSQQRSAIVSLSATSEDGILQLSIEDESSGRLVDVPVENAFENFNNNRKNNNGASNDNILNAEIVTDDDENYGSDSSGAQIYRSGSPMKNNRNEERLLPSSDII